MFLSSDTSKSEIGDIEDIGEGKLCVICPWHRYSISLATGESFYTGLEGG